MVSTPFVGVPDHGDELDGTHALRFEFPFFRLSIYFELLNGVPYRKDQASSDG
jgi:hypothetical protein